jgi:hypothetical protein
VSSAVYSSYLLSVAELATSHTRARAPRHKDEPSNKAGREDSTKNTIKHTCCYHGRRFSQVRHECHCTDSASAAVCWARRLRRPRRHVVSQPGPHKTSKHSVIMPESIACLQIRPCSAVCWRAREAPHASEPHPTVLPAWPSSNKQAGVQKQACKPCTHMLDRRGPTACHYEVTRFSAIHDRVIAICALGLNSQLKPSTKSSFPRTFSCGWKLVQGGPGKLLCKAQVEGERVRVACDRQGATNHVCIRSCPANDGVCDGEKVQVAGLGV